jgi:hypothetical protein
MNEQLFLNLFQMVKNDADYFETGVAQYILNRLGSTQIEQHLFESYQFKNFTVQTNLLGLISLVNKSMSNSSEQSVLQIKHMQTKEKWNTLLTQIDPELITNPIFILGKKDPLKKAPTNLVSLNLILALSHFKLWYTLLIDNPDKFQLTKNEEFLLLLDLIEEEQEYAICESLRPEGRSFFCFS